MGNQVVDVDLAVHVPVDDFRNVRAPACPAEGRAAPRPAGDQLERPGRNFLTGTGDADDDAFAPTLVTAFQCLTHNGGVADALERIIGPATGQLDQMVDQIVAMVLGIDEVGHAELAGQLLARRVQVDADDHIRTDQLGALQHVQPDTAQPEHDHVRSRLHLGRVDDGADARGHAAADVADLIEGGVFANLGERDFRHHGEVGKGRGAHVVEHVLAVQLEPRGAVGHHALALGRADRLAQVGFGVQAVFALPAFGRVQGDDVVALLQGRDAGADLDHHAGTLVAQDGGKDAFRIGARQGEFVRVADARGLDFDQAFALLGAVQFDGFDGQGGAGLEGDGGAGLHF